MDALCKQSTHCTYGLAYKTANSSPVAWRAHLHKNIFRRNLFYQQTVGQTRSLLVIRMDGTGVEDVWEGIRTVVLKMPFVGQPYLLGSPQ
jgi:hypothetical protein